MDKAEIIKLQRLNREHPMRALLHRVFQMGQDYWCEADSLSHAANKRSDVTLEQFRALVDEEASKYDEAQTPRATSDREDAERWREALLTIRDSTHKSAVVLRGIADTALVPPYLRAPDRAAEKGGER